MEKYSFKSQRTLIKDLDNTTETCTQNLPRNRTIRPISGMQKTRPLTALTSIGATSITTKGVTSQKSHTKVRYGNIRYGPKHGPSKIFCYF